MTPKKVIIDCDPGIDDAVALTMALFEPELDVVAVTAVAGNVPAPQATRNVQAVIEQLDPPRFPRIGAAQPPEGSPPLDAWRLHGEDGLGNSGFEVSQLHHQHSAAKVIADAVRAAPYQITFLALGPLTNLAYLLQKDPQVLALIDRIIISGGCVTAPGNVTPVAEFNMFFHPQAARAVFRSPTTKQLVPLDVTSQVRFSLDWVERLPSEETRVGRFLQRILQFFFRTHHHELGQESIALPDAVALLVATQPELFEMGSFAVDVEIAGELTTGATVLDRRSRPQWRPNADVALRGDAPAIAQAILRSLARAAGTA